MAEDLFQVSDETIPMKVLKMSVDDAKSLWRIVDFALNNGGATGGLPQAAVDFGNELKPKLPNPNQ